MLIAILLYAGLLAVIRNSESCNRLKIILLFSVGYWFRIILSTFIREVSFFSHGIGGDYILYESLAEDILVFWKQNGLHYVTSESLPWLQQTDLPSNMIAFVSYVSGGYSRIGSASIPAFFACLSVFLLYQLYRFHDEEGVVSIWVAFFTLFNLTFLYYTSDTYKDGYVVFFVVAIFWSSFKLEQKSSLWILALELCCFLGLWHVRHYLVYPMVPVFLWGFLGRNELLSGRRAVFMCFALLVAYIVYLFFFHDFGENMEKTWGIIQSESWHRELQGGGSGVDSSEFSFPVKAFYTLFSPLPWQSGGLGLQVGKLDVFIWYYLYFQAATGFKQLLGKDRIVAMLFVVALLPIIGAYAISFSNIGLIVRQRIPILFLISILAVWGKAHKSATRVKS